MFTRKLTLAAMALGVLGFGQAAQAQGSLNLYCSVQNEWCQAIVTNFQRDTGIRVNMTQRGSGESLAAIRSAVRNRLQNSLNLALGSAIASIGLTIPAVAVVSLVIDMRVVLGLSSANMTLLALTLFASVLTLGTGRTTVLQGASHLVIFAVFLLLAAEP